MSNLQNESIAESLYERFKEVQMEMIEADEGRLEDLQIELGELEMQLAELGYDVEDMENE